MPGQCGGATRRSRDVRRPRRPQPGQHPDDRGSAPRRLDWDVLDTSTSLDLDLLLLQLNRWP